MNVKWQFPVLALAVAGVVTSAIADADLLTAGGPPVRQLRCLAHTGAAGSKELGTQDNSGGAKQPLAEARLREDSLPMARSRSPATVAIASGVLVPASELVAFTGGTAFQGARIDRLLVKEGDLVEQGQPIARSDKYEVDAAAVARCRADLARAQLQQVKAGAKSHEIDAQMARCRAAESEMMHAARECRRYAYLLEQGAVSKSLAEEKQLTYEVDRQKLEQAQQTLWSLSEVRAQDVLSAQEELHVRQAELKRALDQLSLDVAVAPLRGTLLQINTHEGEQIGAGGIATIGDTGSMYANLEVFDADIARLRCGQAVELTSPAFSGYMHGKVCRIDSLVQTRAFSQQDPADDIDARVIKVRVKLDTCDSKRAARFCNLRVTARVLS